MAILAGGLSGLAAGLVFATLHAIIIVPIWTRMGGGLAMAILAGMVVGLAFAELERGSSGGAVAGMRFGALLWLSVAPVTLVDALVRPILLRRFEWLEVVVAIAMAIAGGALLGHWRGGTRRAVLAGAAAAVMLTVAMAGPVPIGNGLRALKIFLAVFPACLAAGLVLGLTVRLLSRSSLLETGSSLSTSPPRF